MSTQQLLSGLISSQHTSTRPATSPWHTQLLLLMKGHVGPDSRLGWCLITSREAAAGVQRNIAFMTSNVTSPAGVTPCHTICQPGNKLIYVWNDLVLYGAGACLCVYVCVVSVVL